MHSIHSHILDFIDTIHDLATTNAVSKNIFQSEWDFLKGSETKLVAILSGEALPVGLPGEPEYGMVLYWIHQGLPGVLAGLLDKFKFFNLPDTAITNDQYTDWLITLEGGGLVIPDGSLISTTKYAVLDSNYLVSVLYYLRTRYSSIPVIGIKPNPFGTTPAKIDIPDAAPLRIAIFGDWGTGVWQDSTLARNPAQLVSLAIKQLNPDIVIHLGDVYYSGLQTEEMNNFDGLLSPGSKFTFTLNSNHEMYDGAIGYFQKALVNPSLTAQNNTSYFALTYQNWVILGLDSAYYDTSALYKHGAITDQAQLDFIREVMAGPGAGKQVIVLTHHNPISYDGKTVSLRDEVLQTGLAKDVHDALGKWPDFWYYGHLHNGIVYDAQGLTDNNTLSGIGSGDAPACRCMGHGAIPMGAAFGITDNNIVKYSAGTPVGGHDPKLSKRVLNGFAVFTLEPKKISEEFFEVANDQATIVKTTSVFQTSQTYP